MQRSTLASYVLASLLYAPTAHAQTPTDLVLHNFADPPKGAEPLGGVIRDAAGDLYGTTSEGGSSGVGVVFKLDAAGHEMVLYSFTGGADGAYPSGDLIRDSAGNLYGTTSAGGYGGDTACAGGCGVVYKLDPAGQETVLHAFTGYPDGANPAAGPVRDQAGNLYGTTKGGGNGYGVLYKLDPAGNETVLHSFCSVHPRTECSDGGSPQSSLILDAKGTLYGTAPIGGKMRGGVLFKADATGHYKVIYEFGADGDEPIGGVIRDSSGNFYGTTYGGGTSNAGVVYKLDTAGNQTVLYNFTGAGDGGNPTSGVVRDLSGSLYGTTPKFGQIYI
jgi:uncharacterized repeat protein (TIGR03803 family)